MAELLKGAAAAASITEELITRTRQLNERGIIPCLAILRVGERIDDLSYERAALKRAEKIGIRTVCVTLPVSCTQAELLSAIEGINRDRSIHGCLMFRPLPSHLDELAACDALLPEKDIDGMTPRSQAVIFSGKGRGFAPCTAQACIELLDHYGFSLRGKNVAVIGRSTVISPPERRALWTIVSSTPSRSSSTLVSMPLQAVEFAEMSDLTTSSRSSEPSLRFPAGWARSPQRCSASM